MIEVSLNGRLAVIPCQRVIDAVVKDQPIDHRVTQSKLDDGCLPRYTAVAGGFDPDHVQMRQSPDRVDTE